MRLKTIQEISDTVDYLYELICGQDLSYEQAKQKLIDNPEQDYTIDIVNEGEDFFDVDVGNMGFTIYKDQEDGFRICENARAYITKEETDGSWTTYYDDTIDVEL